MNVVFDFDHVQSRWEPWRVWAAEFADEAESDAFLDERGFAACDLEKDNDPAMAGLTGGGGR